MGDITVTPLTGSIGARVDGIKLTGSDDDEIAAVRAALLEHQVLFFPDQDMSDDDQLALASRFGAVSTFPVAALYGATAPSISYIEDTADSPPSTDVWHTDVTWTREPPAMAFLSARVMPPKGGDTMWASLYTAFDRLSPEMQRVCESLSAWHWFGDEFAAAVSRSGNTDVIDRLNAAYPYPGVSHPVVRTHPETGRKALFVSGFMHAIVGMHPDESRVLVEFLKGRMDDPNVQVRWKWQPNDFAIWDERSTNHRGLSDHFPEHRVVRRCTIDGDVPQ